MNDLNKVPEHIKNITGLTGREWKQLKRKQARAALRALKELQSGCAYFPNGDHSVTESIRNIELTIENISVKNWGR